MTKCKLIVVFVLLPCLNLLAINTYIENDTLYNWASELNVRTEPNLTSEIIGKIAYSEQLVARNSKPFGNYNPITVQHREGSNDVPKHEEGRYKLAKSLNLVGLWLRIDFNNTTGYVFDGYLSHHPAPKGELVNGVLTAEGLSSYIKNNFKLLLYEETGDYENTIRKYFYRSGITVINIASKSANFEYILPDFSVNEILILLSNSESVQNRRYLVDEKKIEDVSMLKFIYGYTGLMIIRNVGSVVTISTSESC